MKIFFFSNSATQMANCFDAQTEVLVKKII